MCRKKQQQHTSLFTGLAESRHTRQRCYVNPFCGSTGSCLQPDDVPRVTSFQSALVLGEASADICNFSSLLRAMSQKRLRHQLPQAAPESLSC